MGTTIFAEMSALAGTTGSVNLGQGFPDTDGPPEIAAAAAAAIMEGRGNQYPPGPGIPELRRAIADHQKRFRGIELDPDGEVLVTTGATEAIAASVIGITDLGTFVNYVLVGFLYKTLVEFLFVPVTALAIGWIKKREPSYGA